LPRHRFEAYLDKVLGFSRLVGAPPEGRQSPTHPWQKVFDAVFLAAAMQVPCLLQIEADCRRGSLAQRIGPISADTIGYALKRQSPDPVFAFGCEIARRLKRDGILRSDWSRGLIVAAVDGIEICGSFARCCDACMQREVQHKVRGEMRTDVQYYHRIVAAVIVSTPFPVPLGIRFQKDGEAEVPCALALLQDLVGQLGRRFLDLLVGDALCLQAPFVKEVERLGVEQMGGNLTVESQPGHGAAFGFTIPVEVVEEFQQPARQNAAADASFSDLPDLRIIVAEDHPLSRQVVLRFLKRLGYEADWVANGADLLKSLARGSYDVVLMDVQMPDIDGLEATRRVRRDLPRARQPRIVALTAAAFPEDRARCLEAGMDDCISKPIVMAELVEALRRAAPVTPASSLQAPVC
jgi:CheY-like chemotaxis protein